MGESADNGSAEEEQGIAGELDRSDVVNVSNITNDPNYDAQFTADNLTEFTGFQIKIVFNGTNEAEAPKFKDLRVIALA